MFNGGLQKHYFFFLFQAVCIINYMNMEEKKIMLKFKFKDFKEKMFHSRQKKY